MKSLGYYAAGLPGFKQKAAQIADSSAKELKPPSAAPDQTIEE